MKNLKNLAIFAALLLSSCIANNNEIDQLPGKTITSFQAEIVSDDTRNTAVENENNTVQMLWTAADKVLVTDFQNKGLFALKKGAKTNKGTFYGSISVTADNLYAVYPADNAVVKDGKLFVTIPSLQIYSANGDIEQGARNVMVSKADNNFEFKFYQVASLARFTLDLGAGIIPSSVEMIVENGGLSGESEVNLSSFRAEKSAEKTMKVNIADPKEGKVAVWGLISSLAFTSLEGKVYYKVSTNKGTYTFCRKPAKDFETGKIYNFPLTLSQFTQVASKADLTDGKYLFESNASKLDVRVIRATDSTISVAWSKTGFPANYSADIADKYELYLYDANKELVVAWAPEDALCVTSNAIFSYSDSNPSLPPRWIFTGLTPDTTYYVKVKDVTTGVETDMLDVRTPGSDCNEVVSVAKEPGDVILFENFSKLVWNGDITTLAAGYIYKNYSQIKDVKDGTAHGDFRSSTQTQYQYTRRDREQQLFSTYGSVLESHGLKEWAFWRNSADDATSATSNAVLHRPGYLKLGVTAVRAGIATPQMKGLLGKATVRVTFKAASYGTLTVDDTRNIAVTAMDNCTLSSYRITAGTEVSKKTLLLENTLEWRTYSVELSGVTPSSRIVIRGDAAAATPNNRFHVDDIKVELVKYDSGVDTDVLVLKQVAASPSTVTLEWDEPEGVKGGSYTIALYADPECINEYLKYTTKVSTNYNYTEWPARLTLPYLEENTPYYATITGASGVESAPLKVSTTLASAAPLNAVVFANFNELCWGGDYMNSANGLNTSGITLSSWDPNALTDAIYNSISTTNPTTDSSALTGCSPKIISLFGLTGWTSERVYVKPGYVKFGTASAAGRLVTPAFVNLSKANADIKVSFKACPFADNKNTPQNTSIKVNLLRNSSVVEAKTVTIPGMKNVPGWDEYEVSFTGANNGDQIEIASGNASNGRFCMDDLLVSSESAHPLSGAYGIIKYSDGTPAEGIAVSDGFSVTTTNSAGFYSIDPHVDCWYIYISIPSDCEVKTNSYGQPDFFQRYTKSQNNYNFTLTKLASGPETRFRLFCFADPQCKDATQCNRFLNECIPDVKKNVQASTVPAYGVTLGDVAYSEGSRNSSSYMTTMRSNMQISKSGMPIFQTMGNHDYTYFYGSGNPLKADDTSSTPQIKAQRAFEGAFGPINYSFNRGDAHIVCMRDIIWNSTTDAANYSGGFTDEQVEWLRQDLALVPKTKMVILCVHIPIVNCYSQSGVKTALSLMSQFTNSQIMSGHTHYMRNVYNNSNLSRIYEHVHAAVCGQWWYSNLNGDGCPNGYAIYEFNGTAIKDWVYKGHNTYMNDTKYQIRLYRGGSLTGGKNEYFKWPQASGVLVANVFNADSRWTVKVYENGTLSGTMTAVSNNNTKPTFDSANSQTNPTVPVSTSSLDWWSIGYHIGVVGRGHVGGTRDNYITNGFHLYKYTLKNPNATIKVVATDPYGNTYEQTEIMNDLEYPTYVTSGNH